MTVARLRTEVDSRELERWSILYNREPFGEQVDRLIHAKGYAALANSQYKGSPFKPKDFLPDTQEPKPEQSILEQKAIMTAAFSAAERENRGQ